MSERLLEVEIKQSTPLGTVEIIQFPNTCPHCKRLTNFTFINSNYNKQTRTVEAVIRCDYPNCNGFILVYYHQDRTYAHLKFTEPPLYKEIDLPDFAEEVSFNFVSIFKQAIEAKARGLDQIAGAGFRKSCEFLVKDYAKSLISETDADEKLKQEQLIEKKFVGKVVEEFITDPRVQKVAKRAFWLGNDESHYLRKWTDKDINDLITLIKLTLDWIEIERLSSKYEDEMPEP